MSDLSEKERFVVDVMRLNEKLPRLEWKRAAQIGRLHMRVEWRSKRNLWGRFGGGWNWGLGTQVGSTTVLIRLLVFTVVFSWRPRAEPKATAP